MKTAISIPDKTFERAEKLARRLKKSRSQLYSDAVDEYLARYEGDAITQAINRVIDECGNESDPFVAEAARRSFERSEW
jgi:metal-responsive CopG/Arc/MetJ family transcriptional regulator